MTDKTIAKNSGFKGAVHQMLATIHKFSSVSILINFNIVFF